MEDYGNWYCAIHHSASSRSTRAEDLERWHRERGFDEIGYTWVIEGDGSVVAGRSVRKNGAHVKGKNRRSLGICVVGDNTKVRSRWSRAQVEALREVILSIELLFPGIRFVGHNELAPTACPGRAVAELLDEILS